MSAAASRRSFLLAAAATAPATPTIDRCHGKRRRFGRFGLPQRFTNLPASTAPAEGIAPISSTLPVALASLGLAMVLVFPAAAQKFPLQDISIEGSKRWPASAIIVESGLQLGDAVDPADFEAAVGRLQQTGSLAEVRFVYKASTGGDAQGYALTFQVEEVATLTRVVLDIEALGAADVWDEIRAFAPFAGPEIADTPEAEAYLRKALGKLVERRTGSPLALASDIEANLVAGSAVRVFRPANLPQLSAFHVEGAQAVQKAAIHAAMDHLALGEPYTERRFRRYLEANVLPLYGAVGRLKAAFTELSTKPGAGAGSVEATVRVEEGAEYRLKDVALTGDVDDAPALLKQADFPIGERAELPRMEAALETVASELKRDGYLGVRLHQARSFDHENEEVTWRIAVERGPQFAFGTLHLVGLDEKAEQTVRKRWKLAEGEPMNQGYIAEWAKDALSRTGATGIAQDLKVRPNSHIVDVFITIRTPRR